MVKINKQVFKITNQRIYFLIVFLILFFISAFRNGLGTDYISYAEKYTDPSLTKGISFLFKFIFIHGLRLITTDSVIFFIVTAFITNYFITKTIYKWSSAIWISLIIYIFSFYLSTFNLVRQFLAISLFFYFGLNCIQNKKKWHYIFVLLLIAQIHFAAYFLILFLFFKDRKRKISFYLILWSISIIFVLFKDFQLSIVEYIFKFLANFSFISGKFTLYSEKCYVFLDMGKTNLQLIVKNLLLLIFFIGFNKLHEEKIILYFNLFFFGIILGNFLNIFAQIGPRMAYYGEFALILLVPEYIKLFKPIRKAILIILFIVFFISYGFHRFYVKGESEAIPNSWRIVLYEKISKK